MISVINPGCLLFAYFASSKYLLSLPRPGHTIIGALVYCVPGFQNSSIVESIVYVIPNCIWYELLLLYFYNYLFYKMAYLYLMCSYLKMKIGSAEEEVKQSIKQRRRSLMVMVKKLYDIFEEINEYNTTYWSKYLFVFWLTFGTIAVGYLSISVKGSMETTMTIVWSFLAFYLILVLLLVILTVASVNSAISGMYCKYNSLFIHYSNQSKGKQNLRFRFRTLIKVNYNNITFVFTIQRRVYNFGGSPRSRELQPVEPIPMWPQPIGP